MHKDDMHKHQQNKEDMQRHLHDVGNMMSDALTKKGEGDIDGAISEIHDAIMQLTCVVVAVSNKFD